MPVQAVIEPPRRDLGEGFTVRRALPAPGHRAVGPFVFLDEMGPAVFAPGHGLDVRPHPHIGLSTLTWLFEGEITHRDSLGVVRSIGPGAANWMTAGRGIVHSERTGEGVRAAGHRLWGLQSWIALPDAHAETEPAFSHHPAESLPAITLDGARRTLVAGTAFAAASPVPVHSPLFYIDVAADAGATVHLPDEHPERAVYVADGAVVIDDVTHSAGQFVILAPGPAHFTTPGPARAVMLGGASVGPRHLWWNFVAAAPERIARAADDWRDGHFATVPGDETFIALPDGGPPVRYP